MKSKRGMTDCLPGLQDFESTWLKTKKHYNSFTTGFFMGLSAIEAALREGKDLEIEPNDMKALLGKDMVCHKCQAAICNIPYLKAHLATCPGNR